MSTMAFHITVLASSHFLKSRKVRNTAQSTKMADEIYAKLYIFNRPVQKEGNLPRFLIHAVCNLNLYHHSELKVILLEANTFYLLYVIFQKRVRVFHRGFKHEKTDESTRPQAECFYCFRVFETLMKHDALVFEITSPTKEN